MANRQIKIYGIVQGVGFRPTVAVLALRLGVRGWVRNHGGMVEILAQGDAAKLDAFLNSIKHEAPPQSKIIKIEVDEIKSKVRQEDSFYILKSEKLDSAYPTIIPSDLAICEACMVEYDDPKNRRYAHPFISCTQCGPRYSVIEKMPYDRRHTAFGVFDMCEACTQEYADIKDVRYHSQTIACFDCGPMAELYMGKNSKIYQKNTGIEPIITKSLEILRSEKTLAIKGVGGYHLACLPTPSAVENLRDLKKRDTKPFAIMFDSIDTIEKYCYVCEDEKAMLTSTSRPIVLLKKKSNSKLDSSGDSPYLGAFLPSMGLYLPLLRSLGPLIMTSANLSGLPIVYDDETIFTFADENKPRIEGVLHYEREIITPLDDSVMACVPLSTGNYFQFIRRSKGFAPVPIALNRSNDTQITLALGGQLKSTFAILKGDYCYISQSLSDLDSIEATATYEKVLRHIISLLGLSLADIGVIACDLHPNYFTTQFAIKLASENKDIRIKQIQHHHAHIVSVMAEHRLNEAIGLAWDGTGYGDDGAIWGGECLLCTGGGYERVDHLPYFRIIGGDASMKDAGKTAACLYLQERDHGPLTKLLPCLTEIIKYADEHKTLANLVGLTASHGYEDAKPASPDGKNTVDLDLISRALAEGVNTVETSSIGRLFDAVSALLGVCSYSTYEGEAAVRLEAVAMKAKVADTSCGGGGSDIRSLLALRFHEELSDYAVGSIVAGTKYLNTLNNDSSHDITPSSKGGLFPVALSGGVWNNRFLLGKTYQKLVNIGYSVYLNEAVPSGDGGLALGQAFEYR